MNGGDLEVPLLPFMDNSEARMRADGRSHRGLRLVLMAFSSRMEMWMKILRAKIRHE